MSLRSRLFRGDSKLEAAAVSNPAHIALGAIGNHVTKIQHALLLLGDQGIALAEREGKRYGPSTATAVLAFKTKRDIVNRGYQTQADNLVGIMTIAALDTEMFAGEQVRGSVQTITCGVSIVVKAGRT